MSSSDPQPMVSQANTPHWSPCTAEEDQTGSRPGEPRDLTGGSAVVLGANAAEVDRRCAAMTEELRPRGELSRWLVRRVAMLTVRLDRLAVAEPAPHAAAAVTDARQYEAATARELMRTLRELRRIERVASAAQPDSSPLVPSRKLANPTTSTATSTAGSFFPGPTEQGASATGGSPNQPHPLSDPNLGSNRPDFPKILVGNSIILPARV